MGNMKNEMQVFQSIDPSMMGLNDEAFVRHAYLRLLGRAADDEGLRGYLEQLVQGVDRHEIYQSLAASEEAQRYEARRQQIRTSLAFYPKPDRSATLLPVHGGWLMPMPVSWSSPAPEVADINELLELDGVDFVKAAYVALLGREVDNEGGNNYLSRLRDGWTRMSVVKGLCMSEEGKAYGQRLKGLSKALSRYKKAQRRSWGGWYYRSVLGVESDLPTERHLRATHMALCRY